MYSENSERVLAARYYKKDATGNVIETREELFHRVATHVASQEKSPICWEEQFFDIMNKNYFLPNTPCLANAGLPNGQLAACFVLGIGDSIEEISRTHNIAMKIFKSGGGCGYPFTDLRPEGCSTANGKGTSSGPIAFIKMFNEMTNAIKQGGIRRGANMGCLSVHHPDILKFINIKKRSMEVAEFIRTMLSRYTDKYVSDSINYLGGKDTLVQEILEALGYTNFNFSVGVSNQFMEAVIAKEKYPIYHERWNGGQAQQIEAITIWEAITTMAETSGCPGLLFIDRINEDNPLFPKRKITATNPCGETPIFVNETCDLGSINLYQLVDEDGFDFSLFKKIIQIGIRFLDNVIDVNTYPTEEIEGATKYTRKIGLGVMGYADVLIKLGISYGSPEEQVFNDKLGTVLEGESIDASEMLCTERGPTPVYEDRSEFERLKGVPPLRNLMLRVIAPTGSLSMIADVSASIEPIYDIYYEKCVLGGQIFTYEHPEAVVWFERNKLNWERYKDQRQLVDVDKGLPPVKSVVDEFHKLFAFGEKIPYERHLKVQAAWQKHIDGGISKTITMPSTAGVGTFSDAYMSAYHSGCKGITAFKASPVKRGVYSSKEKVVVESSEVVEETTSAVQKRPNRMQGITEAIKTSQGTMYVTINFNAGTPFEVFVLNGKTGYESAAKDEAIGRLISLLLRSNVPVEQIVDQLDGISCDRPKHTHLGLVRSIPDAISKLLRTFLDDDANAQTYYDAEEVCEICNAPLIHTPGSSCKKCPRCGIMCGA